jgi:hypothetical protein
MVPAEKKVILRYNPIPVPSYMKKSNVIKKLLAIACSFLACSVYAQKGDELLVYSMKGNVTVIENNLESRLKIGKVLKPGSSVKTQRLAKLTMVCKQGKPLSITKEGTFPVTKWKDSCATANSSVTSKYFQYIWDQLYIRSDDYKLSHPETVGAVVRNEAPVRGEEQLEIEFNEAYDTLNYASGTFSLSWTANMDYAGKYNFVLYDIVSGKYLYEDSIDGSSIMLDKIKKYMRPGNMYGWSVGARKTGVCNGGVIKYTTLRKVSQQINKFQKAINVPENQAAQYFRVAYSLENSHYLADAFAYYQKAAKAAPDVEFYTEKLNEFRTTFRLGFF